METPARSAVNKNMGQDNKNSGSEQSSADRETTKPPAEADKPQKEIGGRKGPEPTRYGDWEKNGIISDF